MQSRIKELRKSLALTQGGFARRLSLSRNFIAQVELGTKEPSDRTISDICREFNVNEQWLRTGEGEMHPPRDRVDEIADIVNAALDKTPEDARKSLIERLSKLTDAEIILFAEVLDRMFP